MVHGASTRPAKVPGLAPSRRLGRAEEQLLVARAAGGDRGALLTLLEAHHALAVKGTMPFAGRGVSSDDLLSEACIGVIEAVSRFDASRGFRFMTYAVWWIKRRVVEAVTAQSRNVRVPRHQFAVRRAAEPTAFREISFGDATDVPLEHVESASAADNLPVETVFFARERASALQAALRALPPRERRILELRHGLGGDECQTLLSVARQLGVSKERVRQLETQAVGRLRARLARFA